MEGRITHEHGPLGIVLKKLSSEPDSDGFRVIVTSVKSTAMAEAGVSKGYLLTTVNGRNVEAFESYKHVLGTLREVRPVDLVFTPFEPNVEQPPVSRVERLKQVTSEEVINLDEVRKQGFSGLTSESGLRSIVWRLVLGGLPVARAEWESSLSSSRELYASYSKEFTFVPNALASDLGTSSRPARLEGQAWFEFGQVNTKSVDSSDGTDAGTPKQSQQQTETESPKHAQQHTDGTEDTDTSAASDGAKKTAPVRMETVEDHPLNVAEESIWSTYFKDADTREEIWKDVQRTHPGLHFFTQETYEQMERVLFVYAKLNPGVRYVQGMNEILAPIFFVLAGDKSPLFAGHHEADSFFCFTHLMSEIRDMYIKNLDTTTSGVHGRIEAVMALLQRHDPEVHNHLVELELNPQFFGLRWITTLLTREFELPDTVRIWDSLLCDPQRFNFLTCMCCTMITEQRSAILQGDFASNLKLLQSYPPTDVHALLHKAAVLQQKQHEIPVSPPTSPASQSRDGTPANALLAELSDLSVIAKQSLLSSTSSFNSWARQRLQQQTGNSDAE